MHQGQDARDALTAQRHEVRAVMPETFLDHRLPAAQMKEAGLRRRADERVPFGDTAPLQSNDPRDGHDALASRAPPSSANRAKRSSMRPQWKSVRRRVNFWSMRRRLTRWRR